MGSSPSALSFLPEHLRFSEFCSSCPCCNTLCLTGDAAFASLFCTDLSVEGTLKAVTVCGASSVVDSCSLPPLPAKQLWSEFPCSIHFVGLGFLALQTTLLGRLLTLEVFFPYFGYLNNLTLSHALFVVLIEILQPTDKELNFSTGAVRLPQACFLICLIYAQINWCGFSPHLIHLFRSSHPSLHHERSWPTKPCHPDPGWQSEYQAGHGHLWTPQFKWQSISTCTPL